MKSITLYFWEVLFSRLPNNFLRRYFFSSLLKNSGDRISILRNLELTCVGGIVVGNSSTINKNCYIDGRGGVAIGDNVSISPRVKIITASHDINCKNFSLITGKVVIEDYVWVCSDVTILPGIRIGKGAVIASSSVVTKDVPDYSVVAGNPAKSIGSRSKELAYNPLWRPRLQ